MQDDTEIVLYSNSSSPWFNQTDEAKNVRRDRKSFAWKLTILKDQAQNGCLLFFFNVDFKVVLDMQPLLGTGPLQDWLRNLPHTRSMMALDTFNDNFCLWRCIALHQGTFPHRSKEAARQLAISFLKLVSLPENLPKTFLDELENVEKHLNRKKPFRI